MRRVVAAHGFLDPAAVAERETLSALGKEALQGGAAKGDCGLPGEMFGVVTGLVKGEPEGEARDVHAQGHRDLDMQMVESLPRHALLCLSGSRLFASRGTLGASRENPGDPQRPPLEGLEGLDGICGRPSRIVSRPEAARVGFAGCALGYARQR